MVRESGISATKPTFPSYLLPTLKFPFTRRKSSTSSSSSSSSSTTGEHKSAQSSAVTTPSNSPPKHGSLSKNPRALSRVAPDTLRCMACASDLAFASQIISKGFTGRHGRAYLVAPPALPAEQSLLNIRVGRSENRQLVTGWHVVADITCNTCSVKLGWKYVDAKEETQKYKVGKFILETERVMTFSSWEDGGRMVKHDDGEGELKGEKTDGEDGEMVFDSDDEDECEDIFNGTWDPETVAERRSQRGARLVRADLGPEV